MLVVLLPHNSIIFKLAVILLTKLIKQLIQKQLAIFLQFLKNKLQFKPFPQEFILQLMHLSMKELKKQNLKYLLQQFILLQQ
jgi:hypothetical protein